MPGFANMDKKGFCLTTSRFTWQEFSDLLQTLASFMCRGNISLEQRQEYQEHAAALYAAGNSLEFISREFGNIEARIAAERDAFERRREKKDDNIASNAT